MSRGVRRGGADQAVDCTVRQQAASGARTTLFLVSASSELPGLPHAPPTCLPSCFDSCLSPQAARRDRVLVAGLGANAAVLASARSATVRRSMVVVAAAACRGWLLRFG